MSRIGTVSQTTNLHLEFEVEGLGMWTDAKAADANHMILSGTECERVEGGLIYVNTTPVRPWRAESLIPKLLHRMEVSEESS